MSKHLYACMHIHMYVCLYVFVWKASMQWMQQALAQAGVSALKIQTFHCFPLLKMTCAPKWRAPAKKQQQPDTHSNVKSNAVQTGVCVCVCAVEKVFQM